MNKNNIVFGIFVKMTFFKYNISYIDKKNFKEC